MELLLLYYHWFFLKPYIQIIDSVLNPVKSFNALKSLFSNAIDISIITQSEFATYFTFGVIIIIIIAVFLFSLFSFIGKFTIYETDADRLEKEYNAYYNYENKNQNFKEKKFKFTKKIKIIILSIVGLIIGLIMFVFIKNYIDDMAKTKISILNNHELTYIIKRDAITLNYEDEKTIWSGFASIEIENVFQNDNKEIQDFLNSIKYTTKEKNSKLKNGDEITITISYDKKKADELKIKLIDTERTIEINNLEEMPLKSKDIDKNIIEVLNEKCKKKMKEKYSNNNYKDLEYFNMGNTYKVGAGGNTLETVYDIKYKYSNHFTNINFEFPFSCYINNIKVEDKEINNDILIRENVLFKDTESYFGYLKEINELSNDTEFFNE